MNIVVLSLLILCYSLVLGIIFAQVLLTAPVVFKVLDDESQYFIVKGTKKVLMIKSKKHIKRELNN